MQPEGLIPQRKEKEQFYFLHKIGPLALNYCWRQNDLGV